jgi:epoxyqueuosine reductase
MDLISIIQQQAIKDKAIELGFDAIGFTSADELPEDAIRLKNWLSQGYNANMEYMAANFEKRINPSKLVEGAQSFIVVLLNYFPQESIDPQNPQIARYAYGKDYHDVVKSKLQQLFDYIKTEIYPPLEGRIFTDSAPVLERALAVKAGLGWIGKNSNLIHPQLGSFIFIGELIVNLPLQHETTTINNRCGSCNRCIEACPTNSITADKMVDANRCISYLTIENKGEIPSHFGDTFKNWIYGCDICQEVCPWNRQAKAHHEPHFTPHPNLLTMTQTHWQKLTEKEYQILFKGSAIKRAKYHGLMRNISFTLKTNNN